jgi:hypothetical protein
MGTEGHPRVFQRFTIFQRNPFINLENFIAEFNRNDISKGQLFISGR